MANKQDTAPVMNETQQECFDYYIKLGGKRSLAKVAEHFKEDRAKMGKWSKKFEWVKMVQELQAEANKAMKKQLEHEVLANAEKLTDYKLRILLKMLKAIDDPMTTVKELSVILKAIKIELGEPTEIAKGTMQLERDNPFSDLYEKFLSAKNGSKATK